MEDIQIEDLPLLALVFPSIILDYIYERDVASLVKKAARVTQMYLELRARQIEGVGKV